MQLSIVFLALLALVAAIPTTPKYHAADQDFLKKQQDVIYLLENIAGTSVYTPYYEMGVQYEFDKHYDMYENPAVVKYYYGLYKAGQIQPKGTPFSYSVSQLRKEVELLTQIFLGAKDYQTFLYSAAWARVYVNQDQFVTAYSNAVIQRHDMYGVALPAPYEVYPHYFFNSNIIQMVQDYVNKYAYDYQGKSGDYGVYNIYVNYTSYLPYGENKIAYFTEDIGLSAYYSYVQLASYMMPYGPYADKYEHAQDKPYAFGHGAHYYYIHQQFLARYNLERLSQGLDPIRELDYYYEHFTTPYNPHFRYLNGNHFPGRDEHVYVTPRHHHYELVKLVRSLEARILDAIHAGHVITPEGKFLSLYQPQGLDILGNLIEGTGRSVNPRYYGAFQYVARQLLGNAPEFNNIFEYYPSALELGMTAVRDPMFYQLYSKIIELFHYYQEALPSYQYNDVVVPGVYIEKVEFSDLVTYFSDYQVSLDNAVAQPVGSHSEHQPFPHVNAYLKRLDHKQYEYSIYVKSQKPVPHAVVRVYVGPKYNYNGEPVDINEYRHWFYEIDQFVYDLTEGQNVIVRNSHQATGQSYDYPSIHQLKERVQGALKSQNPYYINYPEQLYGFPARLALPKGSKSGFPLQFFFIITNPSAHQPSYYGPVVEQQWMTYQPHHYQVVDYQEYEQFTRNPVDKVYNGYQTVEVIPDFEGYPIVQGHYHYGYLYNKYPVSYYYPHWQHNYYHGYYPQEHYYHAKEYHGKVPYAYVSGNDYHTYYKQGSYESYGPSYYYNHKYEGKYPADYEHKYPAGYEHKYPAGYEGKYPAGYEGKYPAGYEGKYPAGYEHKYPAGYEHKYPAGYEGKYPAGYEGKYPAGYEHKYPAGYEGKYPAGYEGKYPAGYEGKYDHPEGKYDHKYYQSHQYPAGYYYGSGHYPGQEGYHGTYPAGTYSGYQSHEEYLHQYYKNQYIGDIIGGGVSLDGYPYGYPLDRPLAYSAFYAHNVYVKDVYVYHHDDYYYQY